MLFRFKTRQDFIEHVKLCGNEPRNYTILEEQQEELKTEQIYIPITLTELNPEDKGLDEKNNGLQPN